MATAYHFENPFHQDAAYYDVREAPFALHGLYCPQEGDFFRRCPDEVACATSEWVSRLYRNTAGGRIRFSTDAQYLILKAEWPGFAPEDNMCPIGQSAFDLYEDTVTGSRYVGTFRFAMDKPETLQAGYTAVLPLPGDRLRYYTVHMPLYQDVERVYLGTNPEAVIGVERPYRQVKPVLYYGSSITQGGSAGRPGLAYQHIITRETEVDHINLGFSGSCKGEDVMVDYLLTLDISCFVSDYDHNAPDPEHLQSTLPRMIRRFRECKPDLPIVLVTAPYIGSDNELRWQERRALIFDLYMDMLRAGDKRVWFVDGRDMYPGAYREDCTMDGCHPNDLGMRCLADHIGHAVRLALAE